MTIWQAVVLGVVQGITEFFPISSSGHLVVMQALLGFKEPKLTFDIFLHIGTLASILIFFRKDILALSRNKRLLILIAIASVPTFLIGFFMKDAVEGLFGMPGVAGSMLVITGIFLIISAVFSGRNHPEKKAGILSSLIVGTAQGIAIIPGISRSGLTIGSGLLCGFGKDSAVRFSFLLAIPAILGATVLQIFKIGEGIAGNEMLCFMTGAIAACITGIAAIKILINIVKNNRLQFFGVYCILAGVVVLILI